MSRIIQPLTGRTPGYSRPGTGAPPGDPTPPPGGGTPTGDLITLLNAECVEYWLFNETTGATIVGQKAVKDGAIISGTALRQQRSMITGDPAFSTATDGVGALRVEIAHDAGLAHQGVLVVYAQRPQASRAWQTLANRDDGFAVVGGWGLAVTAAGEPRAYLRRAGGSQELLGAASSATFGNVEAIGMSCGPAGQKLWWGNAVVASAAGITDVIGGTSTISLFQGQAGATPMNGAIQLVALFATQAGADTNIPLIVAELKAALLHANADEAGEIAAGQQVTVPVLANDFYSGAPTVAIDRQPSLGSAEVVSGDIRITAGSTAGDDSLDYTVNASPIARVNFSVTTSPSPPPLSELFYNPFSAAGASHIPIGSGMTYLPKTDNTYANALAKGTRLFYNVGIPFGRAIVKALNSDPLVTVIWNGEQTGLNLPVDIRIPSSFKPERVPKPGGGYRDSSITIYNADTGVPYDLYNFAWVTDHYEAAILRPAYAFDGLGHGTVDGERIGTSAAGVAGPFGILRGVEINTPGRAIEHCLQCALPADPGGSMMLAKNTKVPRILPATSEDNAASNAGYAEGWIPYGALLAIPPVAKEGPNLETLGLSEPGLRLAKCIQRFGIRVVDKGGATNGALRLDQDFDETLRTTLNDDMLKIYPHIQCCAFAPSTWVAGGMASFGGGVPLASNSALV